MKWGHGVEVGPSPENSMDKRREKDESERERLKKGIRKLYELSRIYILVFVVILTEGKTGVERQMTRLKKRGEMLVRRFS